MKYKGKSIEAIGSKMLFGKETLWIHILEDDSFAQVLRSDLEEDMPSNSQAGMSYVRYIAIAARIKEEMAQKRLPAPYESSLISLPHQILILEKVMQRVQTRFMLADEVGMARTFAGVAVKEELNFRKRHNQIIVSLDVPKPVSQRQGWSQEKINDYNKYRIESVVSAGFDMIIIDKARYCIKNEQDVKTTALIRKITQLRKEKGDAQLKVLVFIEFRKVQEYLTKQIERAGLTTVCINGSMDLQKRQRALVKFKNEANVMIATDAAGESLNMQFCHIVFNYDLPWNPMAIEQRIGRVDQYGQKHPVTAFNMLTDNTADTPGYLTIWKVIAKNSNEIKTTYSAQFITDSGKFFAPYRNDVWNRLVQKKNYFGYLGEREYSIDFENYQQLDNNLHGIFHRMESNIQTDLQTIAEKKLRALGFAEQRIARIGIENIRKVKMRRLQAKKEEWNNTFAKGCSVIPDVKLILTVRVDG